MAYNFPNSPSNGDTVVINGFTYTYASATNTWKTTPSSGGGGASVTSSNTAPSSPTDGDLWWSTTDARMYVYYNDGSSSQWVSTSTPGPRGETGLNVTTSNTAPISPTAGQFWWNTDVNRLYIYYTDADSSQWVQATTPGADGADGSSVTSYANYAAFPTSGNSVGDFAFATNTKALYMWDGTEWDRVYTDTNIAPVFTTTPNSTYSLATDGSSTTITTVATDADTIEWSYSTSPTNQSQATIVNNNDGTFTLTPSTNTADQGSFTLSIIASDGLLTTTVTTIVKLEFFIATGGSISTYTSGSTNYKVHTFLSSNTFNVTLISGTKNIDYLVVGGGGSGGGRHGGGGGAGGVRTGTVTLNSTGTNTITIGAGGAGGTQVQNNGADSSALGITSNGGGYGGMYPGVGGGANGGSGGGAGSTTGTQSGGTGTVGQGNDGGDSVYTDGGVADGRYTGGGGGAGTAGQIGNNASGGSGDGGNGITSDIDGTSYYYGAGGGGGWWSSNDQTRTAGDGGLGGGGGGGWSVNGAANPNSTTQVGDGGTGGRNVGGSPPHTTVAAASGGHGGTNTGSGGGGNGQANYSSWPTEVGGNGGSGIVILRYEVL